MKVRLSCMIVFVISLLIMSGCSKSESVGISDDVLVQIGDSMLTHRQVVALIPKGLSQPDSIALFDQIVCNWVNNLLLKKVAEENLPHVDGINKLVEDYRNQLIILEYRKLMANGSETQVPDDSLKVYYEANKNMLRLTEPILKGVFVRMPEDASKVNDVKKWVFSATSSDIEQIEKYGLTEAMQYDYFVDKWLDWSTVTDQIPYRFSNPDNFVAKNKNFEIHYDGMLYMLHISEYMNSGDIMPYEYASDLIREMIISDARRKYDEELLKSFCRKAIKEKKMIVGSYDANKLVK